MCTVCKDWQLGNLTIKEAFRNVTEMLESETDDREKIDHYLGVIDKLAEESNE